MNLKRRIEGLEERLEPRDEPFEDRMLSDRGSAPVGCQPHACHRTLGIYLGEQRQSPPS
jgi:hypothetical protein